MRLWYFSSSKKPVFLVFIEITKWASSWGYGSYRIGEQRRLRRDCAFAQSRQSLRCSHTWSMEVDERSDQKSDIKPQWMAVHTRLKNECTEDETCHNLMRWLKYNFNMATLISLFDTYVGPILNYCSETWGYVKACKIETVHTAFWSTS